jgi:hypothetical protein
MLTYSLCGSGGKGDERVNYIFSGNKGENTCKDRPHIHRAEAPQREWEVYPKRTHM